MPVPINPRPDPNDHTRALVRFAVLLAAVVLAVASVKFEAWWAGG